MTVQPNVYAPPNADLGAPATSASWAGPFRDPGTLARWTVASLAVNVVASLATHVLSAASSSADPGEAARRFLVVGSLLALVSLANITAFCLWFYRVYANLPALGHPNPRFSPGWAVGSFFVPILNLYRPYQAALEAWTVTGSVLRGGSSKSEAERTALIVGRWWALWLGMNLVTRASKLATSWFPESKVGRFFEDHSALGIAMFAVAGWAAIALVVELTRRQREAAAELGLEGR